MGIKVEFLLYGDDFPVYDLAAELKMQNPILERKGQIRLIGFDKKECRLSECTSLMYETDYFDTIEAEAPLDAIYSGIFSNIDLIKEYIKKYQLTVKFIVVINLSENPIIALSEKFIHLASELCAEVEFDSYITPKSKLFWWKR